MDVEFCSDHCATVEIENRALPVFRRGRELAYRLFRWARGVADHAHCVILLHVLERLCQDAV